MINIPHDSMDKFIVEFTREPIPETICWGPIDTELNEKHGLLFHGPGNTDDMSDRYTVIDEKLASMFILRYC